MCRRMWDLQGHRHKSEGALSGLEEQDDKGHTVWGSSSEVCEESGTWWEGGQLRLDHGRQAGNRGWCPERVNGVGTKRMVDWGGAL